MVEREKMRFMLKFLAVRKRQHTRIKERQGFKMSIPSKETIAKLRKQYPEGARIVLEEMDDPYTELRPGDCGSVEFVDDAGGIQIAWDNGEGLAAVWGKDKIRVLCESQ